MLRFPSRSVRWSALLLVAVLVGLNPGISAQGQDPVPYGPAISLAQAKQVLAAAEAEAIRNNWPVAIAVVDGAGFQVAFSRLDNTQLGSIDVALGKAKTAALFRRPTKVFQDLLEMGGSNLRILSLPGATPLEGGIPIVHQGQVIGAIGVSGVKSDQDAQVAQAGIDALIAGTPNP